MDGSRSSVGTCFTESGSACGTAMDQSIGCPAVSRSRVMRCLWVGIALSSKRCFWIPGTARLVIRTDAEAFAIRA